MVRKRSFVMLAVVLLGVVLTGVAQKPAYLATGGGPSLGTLMLDVSEISDFISGVGFAPFDQDLILVGGTGGVAFVPGPTLGGGGWGAWVTSSLGDLEAEYGVGVGGFELGYGIVGSENSVVTVGLLIGGGGADLTLTGAPTILPAAPLGIVPTPTEQIYNSVFFLLSPYADVRIDLFDFAGFKIRVGYLWSPLAFEWHDTGLPDAPHLALDGLYVHFSFMFGAIFEMDDDEDWPEDL